MYHTIDSGIQALLENYPPCKAPVVICVHPPDVSCSLYASPSDQGKTFFIKSAMHKISSLGMKADYFDTFEHPLTPENAAMLDYLFIHLVTYNTDLCAGDPIAQRLAGKDPDCNILIFNPKFMNRHIDELAERFDIAVSNPYSRRKRMEDQG